MFWPIKLWGESRRYQIEESISDGVRQHVLKVAALKLDFCLGTGFLGHITKSPRPVLHSLEVTTEYISIPKLRANEAHGIVPSLLSIQLLSTCPIEAQESQIFGFSDSVGDTRQIEQLSSRR
jgi:hypothetical protein